MKRSSFGMILLAIVCFTLGLGTGQTFFGLFRKTVPPIALGEFQTSAAHGAFLTYGAVLGLIIFGVAMVTVAVSPLFRPSAKEPKAPSGSLPRS
jgi:hypothetical protein